MPLYEYQCEPEGHRFERIQKFSDPPIDTCPLCGGTVRKLLSSPAIQFKGTGWYITDYAKKSSGSGGSSKGSESSESSGAKADGASGSNDSSSSTAKPTSESKKD